MTDPFTIRIIDRMNWTGLGLVFPRVKWLETRARPEFARTGVYVLVGYEGEAADLPTLYIGQADGVRNRIDNHFQTKEFWDWAAVFVSGNNGLNRAHVTWLEYALIRRAHEAGRSRLDNGNAPQEPGLSESEKADTQGFLKEILQILPLVGLRAFEIPKAVATPGVPAITGPAPKMRHEKDTIIVPAQREGFEQVFLGEDCWYAIRVSGGMLQKVKYVAAYQTHPTSAVTHYAPVDRIEPYGEEGKYRLIFSAKVKPLEHPIPYGDGRPAPCRGRAIPASSVLWRRGSSPICSEAASSCHHVRADGVGAEFAVHGDRVTSLSAVVLDKQLSQFACL